MIVSFHRCSAFFSRPLYEQANDPSASSGAEFGENSEKLLDGRLRGC
jgi:hypothetical protein